MLVNGSSVLGSGPADVSGRWVTGLGGDVLGTTCLSVHDGVVDYLFGESWACE